MSSLILSKEYRSALNTEETEEAIKFVKDHFQQSLASALNLVRVTAPMVVETGTGINDDLNGIERAVTFPIKAMSDAKAEVVHSLSKWKRLKLAGLKFEPGRGIYTDMNALRPDEDLSNIHSIYVDQWDWELTLLQEERTIDYLKKTVRAIYGAIKKTALLLHEKHSSLPSVLPETITFIHAETLLKEYPDYTAKQREDAATKKYGAIFIMGIGGKLSDGKPHDKRAPDYDDWVTSSEGEFKGLNGDIIFWSPILNHSIELSSMGIRVCKTSLMEQLQLTGQEMRTKLKWHQLLLNDELPYTIGGGIGQSRLCMFLLNKMHIAEVQSSIWPLSVREQLMKAKINIL